MATPQGVLVKGKAKLMDVKGKAKGEMDLPKNFSVDIRVDILSKVFEAIKGSFASSYGSMPGAGAGYSASGIIKHKRHDWKGGYGKGISRVPRKIMSRSGSSFNWIGATVASTRGGRKPHAPRSIKNLFKKINKRELLMAYNSAFTGTVDSKSLKDKYGKDITSGFVFSGDILSAKTKDFLMALESVFGKENMTTVLKRKKIRSGIGKMRGRKYKTTAGLLFVISSKENMKRNLVDVVKVSDLEIKDLSPNGEPGRITCYTEEAIKEIGSKFK